MAMIHMYNGGELGDTRRVNKQYSRPAPCPDDRFSRAAAEKFFGKAWISRRINTCTCGLVDALKDAKADSCAVLEVGDTIGMVVIPECMILDSKVAYHIFNGVEGVTFDLIMADVDCTDTGANPVTLGSIDTTPPPVPPFNPEEKCERYDLFNFCGPCGAPGGCGSFDLTTTQNITVQPADITVQLADITVPFPTIDVSDAQDGSVLVTPPAAVVTPDPVVITPDPLVVPVVQPTREMLSVHKYFYLQVTALPQDFDCTQCCIDIMVSVGVDETRRGD